MHAYIYELKTKSSPYIPIPIQHTWSLHLSAAVRTLLPSSQTRPLYVPDLPSLLLPPLNVDPPNVGSNTPARLLLPRPVWMPCLCSDPPRRATGHARTLLPTPKALAPSALTPAHSNTSHTSSHTGFMTAAALTLPGLQQPRSPSGVRAYFPWPCQWLGNDLFRKGKEKKRKRKHLPFSLLIVVKYI